MGTIHSFTRSMPTQAHFSIDEPDNQRLASLCGALDAHLRLIETALTVRISRRGNQFTLSGQGQEPEIGRAHV